MKLYSITEGNILLIENQQEYLQKKYPDISPQQIQQAIDLDRRNAEKLILGLKQGIIDTIQPESIEAVAHLDPFAKTTTKSETEIAYDNAIKEAKKIHPKYWQWIIRIKKTDPQAQIDEGIFHYLEAEGLKSEDIIDKTLEQITQASTRWHDEQFKDQQTHGQYTLTPEKDAILTIDAYAWVPVEKEDELTEGAKMGNCIGRYCKTSDTTKIYSLRNKYNNPHVSLSIIKRDQIWALSEIKGKSNKTPIDKYIPYIQKFCVPIQTRSKMETPNRLRINIPTRTTQLHRPTPRHHPTPPRHHTAPNRRRHLQPPHTPKRTTTWLPHTKTRIRTTYQKTNTTNNNDHSH
jgi:hypothetical protein